MDEDNFKFQVAVTGERKEIAGLIAEHFGTQAMYQGTPGFGYVIKEPSGREWTIDVNGAVITQGTMEEDLAVFMVLKMLEANSITSEGQAVITIPTEGHNGITLRNLVNILAAKEYLITKTMGRIDQVFIPQVLVEAINAARLRTIEDFLEVKQTLNDIDWAGLLISKDNITFRWFVATLNPETIQAYIQFAFAVNKMALAQKHSSPRKTETVNEKYTFRTWLLRLGFIGERYKDSRKLFLDRLDGNSSFRTGEQAKTAAIKRKQLSA